MSYAHKIGRERILGPAEVAEIAGVKHRTVVTWRARGILPEPAAVISGVPLWREETIVRWLRDTGYPKRRRPEDVDDRR